MLRRGLLLSVVSLLTVGFFLPAGETGQRTRTFAGVVESDLLLLSTDVGGPLVAVTVEDGETVDAGEVIARIDDRRAAAVLKRAEAERDAAAAALARARGRQRRDVDVAVLEARRARAAARLDQARARLERITRLKERGVVSLAEHERAVLAVSEHETVLAEAEREIAAALAPSISGEIEAAKARLSAAEAVVDEARVTLERHVVRAPGAGRVHRVLHRAGETVGPAAPLVSLLPAGSQEVIFYAAPDERVLLPAGTAVTVACEGCPAGLEARVSHLALEPEYTPPVMFSESRSARLVYRVTARFRPGVSPPPPGQPVAVHLAPDAAPAARIAGGSG